MKTKQKINIFKKVEIPHIGFTILFMDMSTAEFRDDGNLGGPGLTCESGQCEVIIFLQDIKKIVKEPENFPVIAHEVMHAIQIICKKLGMSIENEQEHTAYLMTYILNEVLGYEYNKNIK